MMAELGLLKQEIEARDKSIDLLETQKAVLARDLKQSKKDAKELRVYLRKLVEHMGKHGVPVVDGLPDFNSMENVRKNA